MEKLPEGVEPQISVEELVDAEMTALRQVLEGHRQRSGGGHKLGRLEVYVSTKEYDANRRRYCMLRVCDVDTDNAFGEQVVNKIVFGLRDLAEVVIVAGNDLEVTST